MEEHSEDISQDPAEPPDLSPNRSVGHRLLLDTAETQSINRSEVRELLRLLNAPPDIDDIAPVLKNLAELLRRAEKQWPGILDLQNLEWIQKLIDKLEKVLESLPSLKTSAKYEKRDWLGRNALYCALRATPSLTDEYLDRYRLLQAHYFFAHSAWLVRNVLNPIASTSLTAYESHGKAETWPALRIDPYHAGLCIRDLTESDYMDWAKEYLGKLPVEETPRSLPTQSSVQMEISVHKDKDDKVEFSVQKKVNYISDYLKEIYGIKDRARGGSSSARLSIWVHSAIGDPEDPSLNFGILSDWDTESFPNIQPLVLASPEPIPSEAPLAEAGIEKGLSEPLHETTEDSNENDNVPADECGGEAEEESEVFGGSLAPEDSQFEKSPGSFSGRALGAVHQVIRQQKMFPFAIERLSGWELFPLGCDLGPFHINELSKQVRRKFPRVKSGMRPWGTCDLTSRAEVEALTFLMVMLWTGSDPARACSLVVAPSEDLLGDVQLGLLINQAPAQQSIVRIRVPFPEYKTDQVPRPGVQCESTEYISLPDYANLGFVIDAYARMRKINDQRFQPFQGTTESYAENARLLLKAWDPSGRLTLNKFTSALFGRVMSESGNDVVAAAMITGTRSRLSNVAMHYACRELPALQALYGKTVVNLSDDVKGCSRHTRESDTQGLTRTVHESHVPEYKPRSAETRFVAKRLCPQDQKVQEAFRKLIQKLDCKPYSRSADERWINYHNLYTFYSVWAFAMATGVRKIKTPFLDVREISPINGVARLRDKDGDSGTKTKLVWIPKIIAKQMEHYANHLETVRKRFGIADCGLPCFFLTGDRCIRLVRPKTLFPWVSEYLPGFPVDIHRRFMFNALLDFGCPPETVRIWMGHALTGEEWWRDDATFSHQDYRNQLRRYLVPILNYLELQPLKGLAASGSDQQVERVHA